MDFPYSNIDYSSLSRLSMVNPVLGSPLLPSQGDQLFHSKTSDQNLTPSFLPYQRPSSTTGDSSIAATSYAAYENLYKAYQNAYGSSAAASIFSQQAYRFDPSQVSTLEAQQQLLLQASLLQYPQLSMYPSSALYPSFPPSLAPPSSNSPASLGPNAPSNLSTSSLGSQLSRFQNEYFGGNIAPSLSSLSSKYAHATGLDLVGGQSWINDKRNMQSDADATKEQDQRWRGQPSQQPNESKRNLNHSSTPSRLSENKRGEESASKRSDNRREESSKKNERLKNDHLSASQSSRDNQKRNNDIKDQSNAYQNNIPTYVKDPANQYSSHSKVNHVSSYNKDQSSAYSNSNFNHVSAYNKESQSYSNASLNQMSGAYAQKNDDKQRLQSTEPIMRYSNEYLDSMSRLFASTMHTQTSVPEPLNLQKSSVNSMQQHHLHSTLKLKGDGAKKSDLDQLRRYAQKSRQEAKQHEMRFHRPFEPKDAKLNHEKLSKQGSDTSKGSSKSNKSSNNITSNNYSTNHISASNLFTNNFPVDKSYSESSRNYSAFSKTDVGITQSTHRVNNVSKAINMSNDLKNISKNNQYHISNVSPILNDVPLNLAKVGFLQKTKEYVTIESNNDKHQINLLEWERKIGDGHRVEIYEKWLKKQLRCLSIETTLKRKSNTLNKKKN